MGDNRISMEVTLAIQAAALVGDYNLANKIARRHKLRLCLQCGVSLPPYATDEYFGGVSYLLDHGINSRGAICRPCIPVLEHTEANKVAKPDWVMNVYGHAIAIRPTQVKSTYVKFRPYTLPPVSNTTIKRYISRNKRAIR
jgi:hypothetical protein